MAPGPEWKSCVPACSALSARCTSGRTAPRAGGLKASAASKETPPIPNGLQWDLWLGPAPKRPYHPAYVPFKWRGWKDFGTGAIGDMGIHNAAMPFVGLELGLPVSAEIVRSSELNSETFPAWSILKHRIPSPR